MAHHSFARFFGGLGAALLLAGAPLANAQVKTNAVAKPSAPSAAAPAKKAPAAPKEKKDGKEAAPKRHPFVGKVSAIDTQSMTVTLAGKEKPRVIRITSDTRITKNGKPAMLKEGAVGDEAAGQAVKAADGGEQATSLRFGPKPGAKEGEKAPAKPAKATAPAAPKPSNKPTP